jgi:hypothetical protein
MASDQTNNRVLFGMPDGSSKVVRWMDDAKPAERFISAWAADGKTIVRIPAGTLHPKRLAGLDEDRSAATKAGKDRARLARDVGSEASDRKQGAYHDR